MSLTENDLKKKKDNNKMTQRFMLMFDYMGEETESADDALQELTDQLDIPAQDITIIGEPSEYVHAYEVRVILTGASCDEVEHWVNDALFDLSYEEQHGISHEWITAEPLED